MPLVRCPAAAVEVTLERKQPVGLGPGEDGQRAFLGPDVLSRRGRASGRNGGVRRPRSPVREAGEALAAPPRAASSGEPVMSGPSAAGPNPNQNARPITCSGLVRGLRQSVLRDGPERPSSSR